MTKLGAHFTEAVRKERERLALEGRVLVTPASLRFAEQQAMWEDTSKAKIAFCGRRAGKTLGWALDIAQTLQESPGTMVLYVGITRDAGKDII